LNPGEEATLTVAGLTYVPEAESDLRMFLSVLKLAAKAERNYEPVPGKSDGPQLTSDDLASELQLSPSDIKRLRLIANYEPWIGSGSLSPTGYWVFQVTREVRKYRSVETIEQYVQLRQEAYKNAYGAVPPVAIAPRPRIPRQSRLYPTPAPTLGSEAVAPSAERQVFVIMPFAKKMNPVYVAIRDACGLVGVACKRSDEIVEVGKITEQLYEALQGADVIIADITRRNPNVMYELGWAHARNKPVILLNSGGSAPFDVADYRQIRYRMDDLPAAKASLVLFLRNALRLDD